MSPEVIIGWSITIIIALAGWVVASIQSRRNRRLEKANKLADRRFEAYNGFLVKMDSIAQEMNKLPQTMIKEMTSSFLTSVMNDHEDTEKALVSFNEKLVSFVVDSLKPVLIMKQELSSLKLVASQQMLTCIQRMEVLTDDLYNEFSECLSSISPQKADTLQNLKSIGQSERVKAFAALYQEMTELMRKEIQPS